MNITESIKFDKPKEENESLKNKLDEKDKEIVKLKEEQLYKEDFIIGCLYCIQQDKHDKCLQVRYFLKKYSEQKYDKLPSKEDK